MRMSLRNKYVRILSAIAPPGAAGIALLLGSTMPSAAIRHSTSTEPLAADQSSVSERLAAIREAVLDVAKAEGRSNPTRLGKLVAQLGRASPRLGLAQLEQLAELASLE